MSQHSVWHSVWDQQTLIGSSADAHRENYGPANLTDKGSLCKETYQSFGKNDDPENMFYQNTPVILQNRVLTYLFHPSSFAKSTLTNSNGYLASGTRSSRGFVLSLFDASLTVPRTRYSPSSKSCFKMHDPKKPDAPVSSTIGTLSADAMAEQVSFMANKLPSTKNRTWKRGSSC